MKRGRLTDIMVLFILYRNYLHLLHDFQCLFWWIFRFSLMNSHSSLILLRKERNTVPIYTCMSSFYDRQWVFLRFPFAYHTAEEIVSTNTHRSQGSTLVYTSLLKHITASKPMDKIKDTVFYVNVYFAGQTLSSESASHRTQPTCFSFQSFQYLKKFQKI